MTFKGTFLWLRSEIFKCFNPLNGFLLGLGPNRRLYSTKHVNMSPLNHPSRFEAAQCHPARFSQLLLQAQVLLHWLTHGSQSAPSFNPATSVSVSSVSPGLSLIPFQPSRWLQLPLAPHWNWMVWWLAPMVDNCPCNVHETMKVTIPGCKSVAAARVAAGAKAADRLRKDAKQEQDVEAAHGGLSLS